MGGGCPRASGAGLPGPRWSHRSIVSLDGTPCPACTDSAMRVCIPFARCSAGRRLIYCLLRQPARRGQGEPDGHRPANPVPAVHAHPQPHGHHHPAPAPRGARGAASGRAPAQEGADVPVHLPRPDEGTRAGPVGSGGGGRVCWGALPLSHRPFETKFVFPFLNVEEKVMKIYTCNYSNKRTWEKSHFPCQYSIKYFYLLINDASYYFLTCNFSLFIS